MRFTLTAALLASLAYGTAATAAAPGANEAFYRCKDGAGQTHYGDSKPRQCEGLDTEVLNANGMVVRVIEGLSSRREREQREVGEAGIRKQREERQLRDKMLIETYLSVADIERLRDQRLELLDSQYRVTEQNIANLRDRQKRLEQQVARFKPYSNQPNAQPLPDHLAEEMVNTVNGMRVYEETLAKARREQDQLKATFGADIARFKELKGIR